MRDFFDLRERFEAVVPALLQERPQVRVATAAQDRRLRAHFIERQAELPIVATTQTASGQRIDWIERQSQGAIAAAPPAFQVPAPAPERQAALTGFGLIEQPAGMPDDLVPLLRREPDAFPTGRTLHQILSKGGSPLLLDRRAIWPVPPEENSPHDYAYTGQYVANFGCETFISANEPFTWYHDEFSLAQLGLSHGSPAGLQTIEVGWQSYKDLYGDRLPHLFVYYTTNGYTKHGDNIGGYNRDVKGWVQVSSTIFPGTTSAPRSTAGGPQFEMHLKVQLWQGNYWVAVNGNWIGYYPASLFRADALGTSPDHVGFWGEIVDSADHTGPTATWMGSGYWSAAGWTFSAYQRSLMFQSDANGTMTAYTPDSVFATDTKEYTVDSHPNSGTGWGSYFWFGGPGTGAPLGSNPPPVG